MSGEFDAQTIHALADEFARLQRVAHAAERFMQHIGGYRIAVSEHETQDIFHANMPEAVELEAALKDWRAI